MFVDELFATIHRRGGDRQFGAARLADSFHRNRPGRRIDLTLIGQADVGGGFSSAFGHEISKIAGHGNFTKTQTARGERFALQYTLTEATTTWQN